jgi:uncharacterized protein YbjT (DUF2867 family)
MKIAVSSGNVGTQVAVELARLGHDVVLMVRAPKLNAALDSLGIRQVPFDMSNEASTAAVLRGNEAFFSLTPLVANMVELGRKGIRAAKEAGVSKIVRSSAQGAGPAAAIQLGRWHYDVERAVEDSGIPFTILRPGNFMQNFASFGTPETIKTQSAFYAPIGEAKVSPIDARDISAVAARVTVETGHEGRRYELTGSESLSNREIAEIFSRALGRTIAYVSIPAGKAAEAMAASGIPPWLVGMLSELNALAADGRLAAVKPDTESILGRRPITFSKFVQDNISSFAT